MTKLLLICSLALAGCGTTLRDWDIHPDQLFDASRPMSLRQSVTHYGTFNDPAKNHRPGTWTVPPERPVIVAPLK